MAIGSASLVSDFALIIGIATAFGILARQTKQPTLVAYIAAGLLLGPVGMNLISETELTAFFSELGLVFLLFLIGLEIELDDLGTLLKPITLIGLTQMAIVAGSGTIGAYILGYDMITSLFIGAAMMFSSTALVVKLLADKNETSSLPGRLDIGILLIQDVIVVLLLAVISLGNGSVLSLSLEFLQVLVIIILLSGVSIIAGTYIIPRIIEQVDDTPHTLFIHGLAWAFLLITIVQQFDISIEIGAFVAGLGLGQLPYSNELQERVRPLTDLFMAIFFVNFGLNISAGYLGEVIIPGLVLSGFIIVIKFLSLFILIDRAKFTPETSFIASINMTQISEFGLILASLAYTEGFIGESIIALLSVIAITTMGLSSYLIRYNRTIHNEIEHLLALFDSEEKQDMDLPTQTDHALIIGYNNTVDRILPRLKETFDDITVVDKDADNSTRLSRMDIRYIYGDFKHGEMKNAAGLRSASFVLSFAEDKSVNKAILDTKTDNKTIFIRAGSIEDGLEYYEDGADFVYLRNILASEQLDRYLSTYFDDRETFKQQVTADIETIRRDAE